LLPPTADDAMKDTAPAPAPVRTKRRIGWKRGGAKGDGKCGGQPIQISIVDTAENIVRLVPVIEQMMNTGMLAESDVTVIRVQKKP
jgi:hypothetical protein